MIIPSRPRALPLAIGVTSAIAGTIVALYYHRLGLTLSHYDARGHLIVARRVFDSITPGWQQIGAVWLPLPHLINALPVQVDAFYRSGATAVALSILAFAVATGAIAAIVHRATGSPVAALIGSAAFASNPNVLYLQSTPMTEPLLLGLTLLAIALLMRWSDARLSDSGGAGLKPCATWTVGLAFALACLTRYEAWPVTVCALAAAVWTRYRNGDRLVEACRHVSAIALYPALAIVAFLTLSRVVGGEWFAVSGFFVPENKALGQPLVALAEIGWGAHALTGSIVLAMATVGLFVLLVRAMCVPGRADSLMALALLASAALPWAAFVKGHPFRIRYMVPLIGA